MAARERAARAGSAFNSLRTSPPVQRIVQDEEVRQNIRDAFDVSRRAYGRLSNGKPPSKVLLEDKKLQRDLREAAVSLREVGVALREGPKKRKRHLGRKLLLLVIAGGLALALSESLRSKVLDALFGAEEEFDYTSTTVPATSAPETPAEATPTT